MLTSFIKLFISSGLRPSLKDWFETIFYCNELKLFALLFFFFTGKSSYSDEVNIFSLYQLIKKAGNINTAPLKPPISPISIINVYVFLSYVLFVSESLNYISAAGKYFYADSEYTIPSQLDDSLYYLSSVEKNTSG